MDKKFPTVVTYEISKNILQKLTINWYFVWNFIWNLVWNHSLNVMDKVSNEILYEIYEISSEIFMFLTILMISY